MSGKVLDQRFRSLPTRTESMSGGRGLLAKAGGGPTVARALEITSTALCLLVYWLLFFFFRVLSL